MDLALKKQIAEKIIQIDDDELLSEIKSLIEPSGDDFWGKLPKELKQSIFTAKDELDNGKGIPHYLIMEEIKERFLKKQ